MWQCYLGAFGTYRVEMYRRHINLCARLRTCVCVCVRAACVRGYVSNIGVYVCLRNMEIINRTEYTYHNILMAWYIGSTEESHWKSFCEQYSPLHRKINARKQPHHKGLRTTWICTCFDAHQTTVFWIRFAWGRRAGETMLCLPIANFKGSGWSLYPCSRTYGGCISIDLSIT